MNDVTVVKLGGSFAFTRELGAWLDALSGCAGQVVLVPGGGPFADAVRAAQPRMGFDDGTAHHMALLAMEQYGIALVSLRAGLRLADSVAAIRDALRAGAIPVWSPRQMVLGADDIPASWKVTSDSLAAWLAAKLGAPRVLLVKRLAAGHLDPEGLAAAGIVDPAFPRFLWAGGVEAIIAGPADHAATARVICTGLPSSVLVG
jgi:5-(aminomethyl)-3-furanmethanol phosphate kinase